jgi:hypothetical protein
MNWAAVLFGSGILLGLIFGSRLFIRVYQLLAPQADPLAALMSIKLRGTWFLDVAGWLIATIICLTAIRFLQAAEAFKV